MRQRCNALLSLVGVVGGMLAVPMPAGAVSDEVDQGLQDVLDDLAEDFADQFPGAVFSITVSGPDGRADVGGGARYTSASAAKAYWIAAAVDAVGIAPVAVDAVLTMQTSDNAAAGRIIDLLGIDAINDFTHHHGMAATSLTNWATEAGLAQASDRGWRPADNVTTTDDAVHFLDLLTDGDLLDPAATFAVMTWLRASPDVLRGDGDWGATLTHLLPASVRNRVAHKTGWLPPGCCTTEHRLLIDLGVVPLPDGGQYAIAFAAAGADDYAAQASFLALASRRVYDELS